MTAILSFIFVSIVSMVNKTMFNFTQVLMSSCVSDLLHSNVFGPVDVPSIGRSVYYVSFIDDLSRRTWVYFLKSKAEVFNHFKEFKAMVELQTRNKIVCLRTDNGSDFFSNDFNTFCKYCGIKRENITFYSP